MTIDVPKDIGLVKLIENANPAYTRIYFGNMDALAKDISTNGLRSPILIAPDYQIIDGARRFEAIKKLGWDWAPTRIADGFYAAIAGIRADLDRQSDFWLRPGWLEIDNLCRHILVPLYEPIKRTNFSNASKGISTRRRRGSDFTDAVAEVFGMKSTQLESMRRIGAAVVQAPPSLRNHMRDVIAERRPSEEESWGKGVARALLDLDEMRQNYARFGTILAPPPEYLPADEQLSRLARITHMLDGLTREVKAIGRLNPAFPLDRVEEFRKSLFTASATFGTMRTQLIKHTEENKKG